MFGYVIFEVMNRDVKLRKFILLATIHNEFGRAFLIYEFLNGVLPQMFGLWAVVMPDTANRCNAMFCQAFKAIAK